MDKREIYFKKLERALKKNLKKRKEFKKRQNNRKRNDSFIR